MPPIEETNETIRNWMPLVTILEDNLEDNVPFIFINDEVRLRPALCSCNICIEMRDGITDDNTTKELVELARQGNEEQFRELAACLMPMEAIQECWDGARQRLNLSKT